MITGMIKSKKLGSMRYIMLVYKYIKKKHYEKRFLKQLLVWRD